MKKKIFFGLGAIALAAVTIIACKRSFSDKFDARGTSASERIPSCEACDSLGTTTLSGVISADRQLSCDTVYRIDGKVFVNNGATLTIPEGTVLKGVKKNTTAEASALVITKAGYIDARGSQACPIVFTSDEASPAPGDWGGIVLLGESPTNKPTTTIIEGINQPSVPVGVDITYGGDKPCDTTGVMRYVRIEYAGASIATDNELNALTCGGVGKGTVLEYIEAYRGNDDGFEFFGGNVCANHLVAYEADDDSYDFDFGYTGTIQFAVSILTPTATYSSNPNGIESDNDASGSAATPRTKARLLNLTIIGLSNRTDAVAKGLLSGGHFRRNSSYCISNSIFMGFPHALSLESAGSQNDSALAACGNLYHGFDTVTRKVFAPGAPNKIGVSPTGVTGAIPSWLVAPFDYTGHDFRPAVGSPAASGWVTPCCTSETSCGNGYCVVETVSYRGAFAPAASGSTSNWMAGWTKTPTDL